MAYINTFYSMMLVCFLNRDKNPKFRIYIYIYVCVCVCVCVYAHAPTRSCVRHIIYLTSQQLFRLFCD